MKRQLFGCAICSVALPVVNLAQVSIVVDSGANKLDPNQPGQVISILLQNTGPNPVEVLGGTFNFQIDDGLGGANAPLITAINLINNPFTLSNAEQADVSPFPSAPSELWTSLLTTKPAFPATPVAIPVTPVGTYLTLAQVTIDTSTFNVPGQTWDFKVGGTVAGDSFFDIIDPDDPSNVLQLEPEILNGTVSIVPEPALGYGAFGLAAVACVLWRRRFSNHA